MPAPYTAPAPAAPAERPASPKDSALLESRARDPRTPTAPAAPPAPDAKAKAKGKGAAGQPGSGSATSSSASSSSSAATPPAPTKSSAIGHTVNPTVPHPVNLHQLHAMMESEADADLDAELDADLDVEDAPAPAEAEAAPAVEPAPAVAAPTREQDMANRMAPVDRAFATRPPAPVGLDKKPPAPPVAPKSSNINRMENVDSLTGLVHPVLIHAGQQAEQSPYIVEYKP